MNNDSDRIVLMDKISEVAAMAIAIYNIPKIIEKTDALLALPGLGEIWRVIDAITWWQEKKNSARFLLVAGHNTREKTSEILDKKRLQLPPFGLKRLKGFHFAKHAEHTKEQSEWVLRKTTELGITSLSLFVSPYHILRAYLTLLKTYLNSGSQPIVLIPAPTPIAPHCQIPEYKVDAWAMVPGEIQRIMTYQKKGDVATVDELRQYLKWLWAQSIIANEE